jgi:hypothetical protein
MPINDAMTLLQRQKPAAQHVAGSAIASDRNDWRSGFF